MGNWRWQMRKGVSTSRMQRETIERRWLSIASSHNMKSTHHRLLITLSFTYLNELEMFLVWLYIAYYEFLILKFLEYHWSWRNYSLVISMNPCRKLQQPQRFGLAARTVKVITAAVCVSISNVCNHFVQCSILTKDIWIKHTFVSSNTYTFIHCGEIWK